MPDLEISIEEIKGAVDTVKLLALEPLETLNPYILAGYLADLIAERISQEMHLKEKISIKIK